MFDPRVQAVMDEVDVLRHRVDDHWQVPAEEARVLAQIVRAGRCRSVCEIGTSYGFSTLHLTAAAAHLGGHLHSIDTDPKKTEAAAKHLAEAALDHAATLHTGRAQDVLRTLEPERPFDFVFLDAVKEQCPEYLRAVTPLLADHCVLATDNTDTHWNELAPFVQHLRSLEHATSCNVSIGNGFELTVISGNEPRP